MDKFPEKGKFDPYRTVLIRNFSGRECELALRNLFKQFGELEFFMCLDTDGGKYPNFAVMQYASITDAKSALHGVLSQTKNNLVLSQPWVGAFGKKDSQTAQQIIRGISLMNKISIQHHCCIIRCNKFSFCEFNRFGIIDHYHIEENSAICEISYASPLSATLAVMGISNPMMEVTLIKNFLNKENKFSSDGFTLSRYNFNFSVYCMLPQEINDLSKIIRHQLSKEWKIFLCPSVKTSDKDWKKPGVLSCLSVSPSKNTLSFRIAVRFEDENANDVTTLGGYIHLLNGESNKVNSVNGMNGHFDENYDRLPLFKKPNIYVLEVSMDFNVFDANRLCKGVFRKKVNLGNTFDMQWYETPETGYSDWLSLFIIHIGFINQYDDKMQKYNLEVDSKIQPVNHFFSKLYDDVFPGVEPVVLLAAPENFSCVLKPVTQENIKQLSPDGNHSFPIKLLASTQCFSYFRIPIIASRSFTLHDGKYRT